MSIICLVSVLAFSCLVCELSLEQDLPLLLWYSHAVLSWLPPVFECRSEVGASSSDELLFSACLAAPVGDVL